MAQFSLGSTAQDTVTGFSGTITAITEYLGGATRIQISAIKKNDGDPTEQWFDAGRVSVDAEKPAP